MNISTAHSLELLDLREQFATNRSIDPAQLADQLSAVFTGDYKEDREYEEALESMKEALTAVGWIAPTDGVDGNQKTYWTYTHPGLPGAVFDVVAGYCWGEDGELADGAYLDVGYTAGLPS